MSAVRCGEGIGKSPFSNTDTMKEYVWQFRGWNEAAQETPCLLRLVGEWVNPTGLFLDRVH